MCFPPGAYFAQVVSETQQEVGAFVIGPLNYVLDLALSRSSHRGAQGKTAGVPHPFFYPVAGSFA